MKLKITSLNDINNVASQFLQHIGDAKIFALYGGMGVGKTTFVKAIGQCMGVQDDMSSPTFAIVNEYETEDNNNIYHFDFYRVNDVSEALDFGYEEYFYSGAYCFIEWPEKIEELLPENIINCYFTELEDGSRELEIKKSLHYIK